MLRSLLKKYMKKLIINCIVLTIVSLFVGCKSIPQEAVTTPDFIQNYYAVSEEDCNFVFEFINQSNKNLKIVSFISEPKEMNLKYNPLIVSDIISVRPGECFECKYNADRLIKDFGKKYCVGIHCFEKSWHWWYTIEKGMKYKRVRIIVTNTDYEGSTMLYPPFKSNNKFTFEEVPSEYNNQNYIGYLITNTPDKYKSFYDTRVFYTNKSNNYGRVSNLFTCSCIELIQESLDKGDFSIITVGDGYKVLGLNNDPLDLNNYISKENEAYDFIYEIVNNSSDKIKAANIIFDDEKYSHVLTLANDIEIEPGKSFQIKYNLETLKKIYGQNSILGLDVKKADDKQWLRGWANNFDHKNDKHTIVVSDGTGEQALDVFDLWKDFSDFEKGVLVY